MRTILARWKLVVLFVPLLSNCSPRALESEQEVAASAPAPIQYGSADTKHKAVVGVLSPISSCSGTIVSADGTGDGGASDAADAGNATLYVLTAAHCCSGLSRVDGGDAGDGGWAFDPNGVPDTVLVGDNLITASRYPIIRGSICYDVGFAGAPYDFCMLKFTGPVDLPKIALPALGADGGVVGDGLLASDAGPDGGGTRLEHVGYGETDFDILNTLRQHGDNDLDLLTDTTIGYLEGTAVRIPGTCEGDSGGPSLTPADAAPALQTVVGVQSYGIATIPGAPCGNYLLGVDSRVSSRIGNGQFITEYLKGNLVGCTKPGGGDDAGDGATDTNADAGIDSSLEAGTDAADVAEMDVDADAVAQSCIPSGSGGPPGPPFVGSDTLFYVTSDAINSAGVPIGPYIGGGSGLGQGAMVQNTSQHIAPMSRMMNGGANLCTFSAGTTNAAGIVVGLDAVEVLASAKTGAAAGCNGPGGGLAFDGTNGEGFANYKHVLALLYGGKDSVTGTVDCNSAKRQAVVNNWSNLLQNSCANAEAACNDATHGGKLWRAYRPDDASGTADVFASIIGIAPAPTATALNGFGQSPYCNALNWDISAPNANCALGAGKQFIGPGGVPQGVCTGGTDAGKPCNLATSGIPPEQATAQGCGGGGTCGAIDSTHRRPPPGTWGDWPDPFAGALGGERGADVLPTSMQDNDPIRRPCIGNSTNNAARAGEEVCNINMTLGLVLPMPATNFITHIDDPGHPGEQLKQYPVNSCTGRYVQGPSATVFTCAPRGTGTKHQGECSNGDSLSGGSQCQIPIDESGFAGSTSQCVATKASVASIRNRFLYVATTDGRAFNLQMRDGSTCDGTVRYVQERIPTAPGTLALDFAGAYNRIHQVETIPANIGGCQLVDVTDQIGCLVHADRCSIGLAGNGASNWGDRSPGGAVSSDNGALLVNHVAPSAATVQLLGQPGAYPLSRKLYLNSLIGFGSPLLTADELALARFEANPGIINPILAAEGYFTLGASSPSGANTPFCEDFNQTLFCNTAGNTNACAANPVSLPGDPSTDPTLSSTSTVCGNGKVEAMEECDPGAPASTWHCTVPGATVCSSTCRC